MRAHEPPQSGSKSQAPSRINKLKSLISIHDLSDADIAVIFEATLRLQAGTNGASNPRDRRVLLAFFEPSTRTQLSFERALVQLGSPYSVFHSENSSTTKGESVVDTFENCAAMGFNLAVVRHRDSDVFSQLKNVPMAFINAGCGSYEHPTQALLDCFTMMTVLGDSTEVLKNKTLTIIGDILHSRVARSTAALAKRLGMNIVFCGPPGWVSEEWKQKGYEVFHQRAPALEVADVVMALRSQVERHGEGSVVGSAQEFSRLYGISREMLEVLPRKPYLLHPGPVRWGEELSVDVKQYARQCILKQVENGVWIRHAVLEWCGA